MDWLIILLILSGVSFIIKGIMSAKEMKDNNTKIYEDKARGKKC